MAKNIYPCTQQELGLTAETAWNFFLLHIGDFTRMRKAYTIQYYEERMRIIEEARQIKDRPALQKELKLMRKEFISAKDDVLHRTRCLKQFIINAFDKDMSKTLISIIGKKNFISASNNNWTACESLISACTNILNEKKEALLKDNNMPMEFIEECNEVFKRFSAMHLEYRSFITDIKVSGIRKVQLNNQVYRELTNMIKHAQLIYRDRADMQALFRFDKLLKTARKKKKNSTTAEAKPAVLSFLNKVAGMF